MIGITDCGAYIPQLRLSRQACVGATGWLNPALFAHARGTRAIANWDEDSVTMAVEAARNCLNYTQRDTIGAVYYASLSAPFAVRLNASIIASAIGLNESLSAIDVTSSPRCGISALVQACHYATSNPGDTALTVASDIPPNKAGTAGELLSGDAAAAIAIGDDEVIAEFIGSHSETLDFVDAYQGAHHLTVINGKSAGFETKVI